MKNRLAILWVVVVAPLSIGQQGLWETPFIFDDDPDDQYPPITAVNLVHVWDGTAAKVLALSWESPDTRLWTPPPVGSPPGYPGVFEEANVATYTFCGGHSALDDGRVLHVGGYYVTDANLFTPWAPVGDQWNNPVTPPSMAYKRWYPTATTLADGRVLVTSG